MIFYDLISGESNLGTFLKYRYFLRPIFSIFIGIIRVFIALHIISYNFSIFFIDFVQIAYSFLMAFSLNQDFSLSSRVFCSNTSLIVAFVFLNTCFSIVYLEFYFFYFPFFLFAFLYPITFLAVRSTLSFLFISI